HVVWVIAPTAVAFHAARGTSPASPSQVHNAQESFMESPAGQGVPKLDDELESHQVGCPEPEEAAGAALVDGVLVGSEHHRPVEQGGADRQVRRDRELDSWTQHPGDTARVGAPLVAVDHGTNPKPEVGCRP